MFRKLLPILFVFILASNSWAGWYYAGGDSDYCTSCSDYDILCEDAENSCGFWCSYTDNISSGNTVTAQAPSASFGCSEEGSCAIEVDIDCGNGANASKYISTTQGTVYGQGYLRVTTNSMDVSTFISFINGMETAVYGEAGLFVLYITDQGSGLELRMYVQTTTDGEWITGPSITVGEEYYFEWYWQKNTVNGGWFAITPDGGSRTQYTASQGETTSNYNITRLHIGVEFPINCSSSDEMVYELEMIGVATTDQFSVCSGF